MQTQHCLACLWDFIASSPVSGPYALMWKQTQGYQLPAAGYHNPRIRFCCSTPLAPGVLPARPAGTEPCTTAPGQASGSSPGSAPSWAFLTGDIFLHLLAKQAYTEGLFSGTVLPLLKSQQSFRSLFNFQDFTGHLSGLFSPGPRTRAHS